MEVVEVFHMNEGNGDTSYANNSLAQKNVILHTKPTTEEAITDVYNSLCPETISIADLGCSSGPNTFLAVFDIIRAVEKLRKITGTHSPEYVVHLNDLPGNDFNSIFRSLPRCVEDFKKEMGDGFGDCFFAGVAGSFYGRLFPSNTLHFVHSSNSLHWLSQIPKGLEENKGNIRIAASSPPSVIKAYYKQFERDFLTFLKCRSEELVTGGRMVLYFLGRKSESHNPSHDVNIWVLFAKSLKDLVTKGLVEEEKLNSFNVPMYSPSLKEVKMVVEKEGSFSINVLEGYTRDFSESLKDGKAISNTVRAMVESLVVSHFGGGIIDQVFNKYEEMIGECMTEFVKEDFINIVSLTKV
ncbi:PREDICTED: salicylate carboxymethyltransferase-like [Ipomoea nil]|uniref:salicylate carboxymethyltransferase-like n=1 Tax=Ipomoea nil TaxID=35883 RepID=UPI000901445F|nr:PREDICTED: salicylate carboxymethyltransferase-like [Ipomoea nil]XP_019180723.1 PREDICTED: salicylate carboxymethyltransferase-like [Ipomoea nil]